MSPAQVRQLKTGVYIFTFGEGETEESILAYVHAYENSNTRSYFLLNGPNTRFERSAVDDWNDVSGWQFLMDSVDDARRFICLERIFANDVLDMEEVAREAYRRGHQNALDNLWDMPLSQIPDMPITTVTGFAFQPEEQK